ncbi:anacyclamide/piricyclamide family prenylated cyclic peptide [Microcoleus sp. bin38.metabat.b11b12b14.051]|uniref:anacyclamide/piricyclamide family prenylated cyclic peptide n=1 Tax=Microcoleus sp. bin38.metabat.b11b12b14.051 TaxID=2742709 RepID=UPI0025DE60B7|nr:anacyclamide/piricyclamide family prenylated cyclic peptide [Microcoleus sp. bin38.metabat.b11b12b14.051]
MKKKSLRPIQTAPVARDTTATTSASCGGTMTASFGGLIWNPIGNPFAGDDAE